jgi:hypothetical protein
MRSCESCESKLNLRIDAEIIWSHISGGMSTSCYRVKLLGCNEKKVIDILGRRTSAQRMEIAKAYQTVYGESLHKRLKSSFSGKLEVHNPLLMLLTPSHFVATPISKELNYYNLLLIRKWNYIIWFETKY